MSNRSNEYCESCKKFHRKGKCVTLSSNDVANITMGVARSIVRRATQNLYLSRDMLSDCKTFVESEVVKEVDIDEKT